MVITPTIGRIVLCFTSGDDTPNPAIITRAWSDTSINVAIFDGNGNSVTNPPTSVRLVQAGDEDHDDPDDDLFCRWMPFQIGQAQKYDDNRIQCAIAVLNLPAGNAGEDLIQAARRVLSVRLS